MNGTSYKKVDDRKFTIIENLSLNLKALHSIRWTNHYYYQYIIIIIGVDDVKRPDDLQCAHVLPCHKITCFILSEFMAENGLKKSIWMKKHDEKRRKKNHFNIVTNTNVRTTVKGRINTLCTVCIEDSSSASQCSILWGYKHINFYDMNHLHFMRLNLIFRLHVKCEYRVPECKAGLHAALGSTSNVFWFCEARRTQYISY